MARKAADLVAGLYNIAFETDSAGKFYAIAPGDEGADFDTESPIHVHKGRPDELQWRLQPVDNQLSAGGYIITSANDPVELRAVEVDAKGKELVVKGVYDGPIWYITDLGKQRYNLRRASAGKGGYWIFPVDDHTQPVVIDEMGSDPGSSTWIIETADD